MCYCNETFPSHMSMNHCFKPWHFPLIFYRANKSSLNAVIITPCMLGLVWGWRKGFRFAARLLSFIFLYIYKNINSDYTSSERHNPGLVILFTNTDPHWAADVVSTHQVRTFTPSDRRCHVVVCNDRRTAIGCAEKKKNPTCFNVCVLSPSFILQVLWIPK